MSDLNRAPTNSGSGKASKRADTASFVVALTLLFGIPLEESRLPFPHLSNALAQEEEEEVGNPSSVDEDDDEKDGDGTTRDPEEDFMPEEARIEAPEPSPMTEDDDESMPAGPSDLKESSDRLEDTPEHSAPGPSELTEDDDERTSWPDGE